VTCHDTKDTFFHLTRVFSTKDDHLHTLKVDFDRGGGRHAFGETVGRELSSIVDNEIGLSKVCELFFGGTNKHVILGLKVERKFPKKERHDVP
jgi:hypothetical protein